MKRIAAEPLGKPSVLFVDLEHQGLSIENNQGILEHRIGFVGHVFGRRERRVNAMKVKSDFFNSKV